MAPNTHSATETISAGDACPNCLNRKLTSARQQKPYRLICPGCCHTEY